MPEMYTKAGHTVYIIRNQCVSTIQNENGMATTRYSPSNWAIAMGNMT